MLESRDELRTIVGSKKESTSSEWIQCPSVTDFFDTSYLSELADDIKTREVRWFIDQVKDTK